MQLPQRNLCYGDDKKVRPSLAVLRGDLGDVCVLIPGLPGENDDALFAMSAKWDFSEAERAWARIEFAFERGNGQMTCFRFEMPSRDHGHAYPHAQYSHEFVRRGGFFMARSTGQPMNTRYPAFPIYVENPVELLASSFIAFYDVQIAPQLKDALTKKRVRDCIAPYIRRIIDHLQ